MSLPTKLETNEIVGVLSGIDLAGDMVFKVFGLGKPVLEDTQPELQSFNIKTTTFPPDYVELEFSNLPPHLSLLHIDNIYVLISTLSGTQRASRFFGKILQPLLDGLQLAYQLVRTESVDSISKFARETLLARANAGKMQTVLVLSGDGGIVEIINALVEPDHKKTYVKPVIALMPLGTGNALFHSLHKGSPVPSIDVQALRTLLHGQPRALPVFKASFSPGARILSDEGRKASEIAGSALYGAVVASYGLHSTLVADSDTTEYRKLGAARFGIIAQKLLESPHAYDAILSTTDSSGTSGTRPEGEKHGYILVTLVSNLEKTFTISPASQPLDGQLRLVRFGPLSGAETMGIMGAAYNNGSHVGMPGVEYKSISSFKVTFKEPEEQWRRVCIDGLIVAVEEGGWMEVSLDIGAVAVEILADEI